MISANPWIHFSFQVAKKTIAAPEPAVAMTPDSRLEIAAKEPYITSQGPQGSVARDGFPPAAFPTQPNPLSILYVSSGTPVFPQDRRLWFYGVGIWVNAGLNWLGKRNVCVLHNSKSRYSLWRPSM